MGPYTDRAAKHRYGKQRCKTSDNRHFHMKNMNLQIRIMCDTEPTSAELTSSRKRFAKRPFHQWNTIFQANTMEAYGTRDTKAQRHTFTLQTNWPPRKRRQFTRALRDAKAKKIHNRKVERPVPLTRNGPTRPQRRQLTSALNLKNHHGPKTPERYFARFDHAQVPDNGRFGMAIGTLCLQPNTWIEVKMIIIVGLRKLLGW